MIFLYSILEYIIIGLKGFDMPLYEYRCKACGHQFEKMTRFNEVQMKPTCPECESEETEKKLSIFAKSGLSSGNSQSSSSCSSTGGFS